jgi:tetraacyldisaccharide 4'-kinase
MLFHNFFLNQWYKKANFIWVFIPISLLNYIVFYTRIFLYKFKILNQKKLPVKTLVIGNLIIGGSGKTQLVLYLAKMFTKQNIKVGIISRGYKGKLKGNKEVHQNSDVNIVGDEPLMLKQSLNIPVFVGKSRYQSGIMMLNKYKNIELIISDDGLQHYNLHFDHKILINDQRFVTNHLILPVGPFREPYSRLNKTGAMVINNADNLKADYINFLLSKKVVNLKTNIKKDIKELNNINLSIGIGNPERLITALKKICSFDFQIYEDHHMFSKKDFDRNRNYLITRKDAVKCNQFNNKNIWVLQSQVKLCSNFEKKLLYKVLNG